MIPETDLDKIKKVQVKLMKQKGWFTARDVYYELLKEEKPKSVYYIRSVIQRSGAITRPDSPMETKHYSYYPELEE